MTRHLLALLLLLPACDGWPESPRPQPPAVPPAGAVPQGHIARLAALAPPGPPVDAALLAEGASLFRVFCAPCHGATGAGDGVVVARGHPAIAPLPRDAARAMAAMNLNIADAHPVEGRIHPRQRWAIARYVAALAP